MFLRRDLAIFVIVIAALMINSKIYTTYSQAKIEHDEYKNLKFLEEFYQKDEVYAAKQIRAAVANCFDEAAGKNLPSIVTDLFGTTLVTIAKFRNSDLGIDAAVERGNQLVRWDVEFMRPQLIKLSKAEVESLTKAANYFSENPNKVFACVVRELEEVT